VRDNIVLWSGGNHASIHFLLLFYNWGINYHPRESRYKLQKIYSGGNDVTTPTTELF
jgi:hypothetical protein